METGTAEPVAFDGLFGWYSPGRSGRAVVLCAALGFENVATYRGWRDLALKLNAAGLSTLRFDYPGEGDSADAAAGRLNGLVEAIRRAVRFLRERDGAAEVYLVGLRFGGTLAALAGEGEAEGLVLLAPFSSGRSYLRAMTLWSQTGDTLPDGTPIPQDPAAPVIGGHRLPPDLVADLGRMNLAKTAAAGPPPGRLLLLGADAAGLADRYEARGSAVARGEFPGLSQFLANPYGAEIPVRAFATIVAFCAEDAPARRAAPRPRDRNAAIVGGTWRETTVRLPHATGIACTPLRPDPGAPTVVFINSGVNIRSGYGRQTTDMARALSASGIASFRWDLRGVGESEDRPDGRYPLYVHDTVEEVRAVLDAVDARNGVIALGTCSGAYLAFHAACADARIRGAILVNLYKFDWDEADDLDAIMRRQFRSPASYASLLKRKAAWGRLLRGEIRIAAIARHLLGAGLARAASALKPLVQSPSARARTVAGRIAALRRGGRSLVMVYSAGDVGIPDAYARLGRSPAKIVRRLGRPLTILDGTDHNLSTDGAQDRLRGIVLDLVRETKAAAGGAQG
nr:alpha/beta hydrolase family protein [Methylobacterium sp. J-076]